MTSATQLGESLDHVAIKGEIRLSQDLLNKVWKPVILTQAGQLEDLTLDIAGGLLHLQTAVRVKGLLFQARYRLKIIDFIFKPSMHRILLEFSEELAGHDALINKMVAGIANIFLHELFGKTFLGTWASTKEGITVEGNKVTIDLDSIPGFTYFCNDHLFGLPLLALAQVEIKEINDGYIIFQFNLG